ncbi:MAG: hypothetical protein U0984_02480 [Prosthecobacter sp.]|nr:hypothetical protein [Prosthecobacter sp.]
MNARFRRFLALAIVWAGVPSCVSTLPSAAQMDVYEKAARAAHRAEYAALEQQRASGQVTQEEYQVERGALDKRVQDQADTMAWNRHALVQSEMKANSIPTPDQPVDLVAPGTGAIPNSLYNTQRSNAMTGQQNTNLGPNSSF